MSKIVRYRTHFLVILLILVGLNVFIARKAKPLQKTMEIRSTSGTTIFDMKTGYSDTNIKIRPKFQYKLKPVLNLIKSEVNCNITEESSTMVFIIKSAIKNVDRRNAIRRTWASVSKLENFAFRTIFVVGYSENESEILNEEQRAYNDILQYFGPDNYTNIALKTLAGMQWAKENLPGNYLYSSGDDDFIYNLHLIIETVEINKRKMTEKKWPEFPIVCMYGILPPPQLPHRHASSKWKISTDIFKWTKYPHSCLGGLYTTSVSVIGQLYTESRLCETLIVDDVWITGVLRNRLGLPDEMVLSVTKTMAWHTGGSTTTNIPKRMAEIWHDAFKTFNHLPLCIHPQYNSL